MAMVKVRESMAAQHNAALPDGLDVAGYHIVKKIGSGGFSIVYLARDARGQAVALKEYLPSELALRSQGNWLAPPVMPAHLALFRIGLACFFDEARALALIRHPNVVRGRDFFRANQTAYMVTDFEAGHSLQHAIAAARDRGERLNEAFIVATFVKVIDGVRAVHASKFLHLDLKPANIHLRQSGEPVLLDIGGGSLRPVASRPTQVPIFTPGFAPPELQGGSPGPWSDAYGIGAAMYACMLGTAPQPADQRAQGDRTDAQLASLAGIYSGALVQLVRWCLMLDPLVRPHSLLALQLRLRELQPGRPE
jgi:serine/threonine protein kinase